MSVVNSKNWISQPDFSAMSCLKYVSNLHTNNNLLDDHHQFLFQKRKSI